MFKYLASFLFLLFTVNTFAASRVQCGAMKSKYVPGRIGYCAMLPPSYDTSPGKRFPVLYFLHGLGGGPPRIVPLSQRQEEVIGPAPYQEEGSGGVEDRKVVQAPQQAVQFLKWVTSSNCRSM
jgi:hypothetical protein